MTYNSAQRQVADREETNQGGSAAGSHPAAGAATAADQLASRHQGERSAAEGRIYAQLGRIVLLRTIFGEKQERRGLLQAWHAQPIGPPSHACSADPAQAAAGRRQRTSMGMRVVACAVVA